MVDLPRLLALLDRISRKTTELRRAAQRPDDELTSSSDALAAVKYLRRSHRGGRGHLSPCGCERGTAPPKDMRDAFAVLSEAGWLAQDVDLGAMAGFRNLLVHGYAEIDDARVRDVLRTRLDDLDAFRRAIADRATSDP